MSRLKLVAGAPRHLSGWHRDRPDHRDHYLSFAESDLPSQFKLDSLVPIFDQGSIGSCTANMGCAMMAYLEAEAGNQKVFSRLFLYAVTRQLEGTPLNEDSGAQIRDVMKALALNGTCDESLWPYKDDGVSFTHEPDAEARLDAAEHQALMYFRCPNLFTVRASIAQGFPVGLGFSVPKNMMSEDAATTGYVMFPKPMEDIVGGHAIMAISYDDNQRIGDEIGAIGFQNSWGQWGQGGVGYLPYRFFTDGLASDCWSLRRCEL